MLFLYSLLTTTVVIFPALAVATTARATEAAVIAASTGVFQHPKVRFRTQAVAWTLWALSIFCHAMAWQSLLHATEDLVVFGLLFVCYEILVAIIVVNILSGCVGRLEKARKKGEDADAS